MWNEMTNKAILIEIGKRIKETRLRLDISQEELATHVGIGISTIASMERGSVVSISSFLAVLRGLDLLENLDQLIPKQTISPILMKRLQGKKRTRASKTNK